MGVVVTISVSGCADTQSWSISTGSDWLELARSGIHVGTTLVCTCKYMGLYQRFVR